MPKHCAAAFHFKVMLHPERLGQPLRWKKPRRVFVCSMSDLFHEDVPFEFVERVFLAMAEADWHTYQLLTKRPARMREWISWEDNRQYYGFRSLAPHIHLGVSISTQADADWMIPELLRTPTAVRFVSVEPMLERVDLDRLTLPTNELCKWSALRRATFGKQGGPYKECPPLDWVIIGCESGPHRRPMSLEWAVNLVSQCKAANVPCFVKQIEIDGRVSHNPSEWPPVLQVREYPMGGGDDV